MCPSTPKSALRVHEMGHAAKSPITSVANPASSLPATAARSTVISRIRRRSTTCAMSVSRAACATATPRSTTGPTASILNLRLNYPLVISARQFLGHDLIFVATKPTSVSRPTQGVNVERPFPGSSAISHRMRPLICARRTPFRPSAGVDLFPVSHGTPQGHQLEFATFPLGKSRSSFSKRKKVGPCCRPGPMTRWR